MINKFTIQQIELLYKAVTLTAVAPISGGNQANRAERLTVYY